MALPIYQSAGIQYADTIGRMPDVPTANLEMGAKSWASINEKLDRLQGFVFEKGKEQAIAAAQRYAAENPVTKEQLEAAKSEQEGVSIFSAFTQSFYDEALLQTQGAVLANDLAVEGAAIINQMKEDGKIGLISSSEAKMKIHDLMDGYRATVAAFNPEAALKLQANLATTGNSALKDIINSEAKIMDAAVTAGFENSLPMFARVVEDIERYGDSFDPDSQQIITSDELVQNQLMLHLDKAVLYNKSEYIEKFNSARKLGRINGIAKGVLDPEFAADPAEAYDKLTEGNMGKYQRTWNMMSDDDRAKVIDKFWTNVKTAREVKKEQQEIDKGAYRARGQELLFELYDVDNPVSRARALEIKNEAIALTDEAGFDVISDSEIKSIAEGKTEANKASDQVMSIYERQLFMGQADLAFFENEARKGNMSWGQFRRLQMNFIESQRRGASAVIQAGQRVIQGDKTSINAEEAQQDQARFAARFSEEFRRDPTQDVDKLQQRILDQIKTERKSDERAQNQALMNQLFGEGGRYSRFVPDGMTPEEFVNNLIKNAGDRKFIMSVITDPRFAGPVFDSYLSPWRD